MRLLGRTVLRSAATQINPVRGTADLAGDNTVQLQHLAEALQYRLRIVV